MHERSLCGARVQHATNVDLQRYEHARYLRRERNVHCGKLQLCTNGSAVPVWLRKQRLQGGSVHDHDLHDAACVDLQRCKHAHDLRIERDVQRGQVQLRGDRRAMQRRHAQVQSHDRELAVRCVPHLC